MGTQIDIGGGQIVESPWIYMNPNIFSKGIEHNGVRLELDDEDMRRVIDLLCAHLDMKAFPLPQEGSSIGGVEGHIAYHIERRPPIIGGQSNG